VERVTVAVAERAYDVWIGPDLLSRAGELLPDLPAAERVFVVADAPVAERYLAPLGRGFDARGMGVVHLGVPEGERAKSLQVMTALQRQLATQEAHRNDPVVALGGGAVGDLAGFVAATYLRGVPFVQVPTTLLAQVDAAIGGKTGVNLPEGKNLVGAFHQPVAVLADVDTLATLPERVYRSGLAEIAKVALALDLDLLDELETDPSPLLARDPGTLERVVARCVGAKAGVVAIDERDAGRRLVLNYGHTLGHALERLDAFAGRTHGEAISIGMVFAARLAEAAGRAPAGLAARHARLLASLGLDTDGPLPPAEEILASMRLDKKYRGGVRFVLLEDVGRPYIDDGVSPERVLSGLQQAGAGARATGG
jgi:3-dehydroquinate synthase